MAALYAGLMSGTSADGLDACLARFHRHRCTIVGQAHRPYPRALRTAILAAMQGTSLANAADLDVRVADEAAALIDELLGRTDHRPGDITAIGSHGQTLFHHPTGTHPTTIQICDPHRLAVRSGIDVIADFRRADIAAGGEGAPLAPAFHHWAFAHKREPRAVLNLGGIANLTLLPSDDAPVRGHDTGPANALLDCWHARCHGEDYDRDGAFAATGQVDAELLQRLLDDPYFARPPPKSTGREHFHARWLDDRLAALGRQPAPADVQATLAELTARTVAASLTSEMPTAARLLVCGGGVNNVDLMARLQRCLPGVRMESTAAHGIPPQLVESAAFAWLARQRLLARPGNVPTVTGASRALVLGAHIRAPH